MHPTHTLPSNDIACSGSVEPATAAATLRAAADYLRWHGWCQGSFYTDTGAAFPPACAVGAIRAAVYGRPVDDDTWHDRSNPHQDRYLTAALRHLAGWLQPDAEITDYTAVVTDYNDDADRSVDEVIDVMADAADEWDHIHQPTGPVGGDRQ